MAGAARKTARSVATPTTAVRPAMPATAPRSSPGRCEVGPLCDGSNNGGIIAGGGGRNLPAALVRHRREEQSLGDGDEAREDLLALLYVRRAKVSQAPPAAAHPTGGASPPPGQACCRAMVAARCARSSAIESPPSFSSRASARISATIASAITPAAGRAVTSLRSYCEAWAARVSRSTLGNPFLRVAIGFM